MSGARQLDPEIRELLVEAVNDEKSMISKALSEPFDFVHARHRHESSLSRSKPEQLLLDVAREEASWWITETIKTRLVNSTDFGSFVSEIAPGVSTLATQPTPNVARCAPFVDADALRRASLARLSSVALALWPRDESRILTAQMMLLEGAASGARALLGQVVRNPTSAMMKSLALDSLGMTEPGNGTEFYRRAVLAGDFFLVSLTNWLLGALNEADEEALREIIPYFREIGPEYEPCVRDALRSLEASRGSLDLYKPNPVRNDFIRRVESRLPELARRFAHAVSS